MKIYSFHHCDAWQSYSSMELANEYYPDTEDGRRKLLKKITTEIESGDVELIGDIGFLNLDIYNGNIRNANDRLKFGYINTMEAA